MSKEASIIGYYQRTAKVYQRWGGESGAMHSGYFEDPNSTENHLASLERLTAELIRYSGISPGWKVLEAGCGTGSNLLEISKKCGPDGRVWGIDVVPSHLRIAQERITNDGLKNTHVLRQNFDNTGFCDGILDCVIFCESLFHAQEKGKVFREMGRILKPGGVITIADSFIISGASEDEKEPLEILESGWRGRVVSIDLIKKLLEDSGFLSLRSMDLTRNVLPSAEILADKAKRHRDDPDKQDEIMQANLAAAIMYFQLMSEGKTGYFFIRAGKPV